MEPLNETLGQITATLAQLGAVQQQQQQLMQAFLQHQVTAPPPNVPEADVMNRLLRTYKPPAYSGEKGEELDTWIFQLEEYFATVGNVTDQQKIRIASLLFKGQTAEWWRDVNARSAEQRPSTWTAFVQTLTTMFMPIGRSKLARDKLAVARQRERDTLAFYTNYMRRLYLAIPDMAEGEKVDRYVRGLQTRLYKEVIVKDPATFDEAVAIATRYDALVRTPDHSTASYAQATSSAVHDDPMDLDAVWQRRQQPRSRPQWQNINNNNENRRPANNIRPNNIRCFKCGQQGHIALNCRVYPKQQRQEKGSWRRSRTDQPARVTP